MGHATDHDTLDALATALERTETVTAAAVHTPQRRADWIELLVEPLALSPALLRTIADHGCEVTELTRESSLIGAGPGIGMASIQRVAQQSGTADDSEDSDDERESESENENGSEHEEIERNDNTGTDTDGSDMSETDRNDDPVGSLDDLAEALEALDAVLSVDLHDEASRELVVPPEGGNTRLDEMFMTEMDRLEQEGRGWLELVADGTLLSPAILRTVAEHNAGIAEVVHLGEHYIAGAIRGRDK
jgi:hypothetical protein